MKVISFSIKKHEFIYNFLQLMLKLEIKTTETAPANLPSSTNDFIEA